MMWISAATRSCTPDVCIGADGFGFVLDGERYQKFPADREGGDRQTLSKLARIPAWTARRWGHSIGEGTKIDNMVHVGHNCRIGRHVVVAAQTGFSGGVVVDDYAVIGGQVGIGDKARIESHAVLGSGCGILTSKIVHAGKCVGHAGAAAQAASGTTRQPGAPADMRNQLADLKRRLAELEKAKA